jgi:hypothetical protein
LRPQRRADARQGALSRGRAAQPASAAPHLQRPQQTRAACCPSRPSRPRTAAIPPAPPLRLCRRRRDGARGGAVGGGGARGARRAVAAILRKLIGGIPQNQLGGALREEVLYDHLRGGGVWGGMGVGLGLGWGLGVGLRCCQWRASASWKPSRAELVQQAQWEGAAPAGTPLHSIPFHPIPSHPSAPSGSGPRRHRSRPPAPRSPSPRQTPGPAPRPRPPPPPGPAPAAPPGTSRLRLQARAYAAVWARAGVQSCQPAGWHMQPRLPLQPRQYSPG